MTLFELLMRTTSPGFTPATSLRPFPIRLVRSSSCFAVILLLVSDASMYSGTSQLCFQSSVRTIMSQNTSQV